MNKSIVFLSFLFGLFYQSAGQTQSEVKILQWENRDNIDYFENCVYKKVDNETFPIFYDRLPVANAAFRLQLIDKRYETTPSTLNLSAAVANSQASTNQYITYQKGNPILNIEIFPYRVSPTGKIEKLTSFRYKLVAGQEVNLKQSHKKAGTFAAQSVLSTSDWFKFKITKDGVHKITGEQLANLNIDVANLDANTVKVFGHVGGMLSEVIEDERTDDLGQLAVELVDANNNNRMDPQDFIRFYAQPAGSWVYTGTEYKFDKNVYDDNAYIYLTVGGSQAKKITASSSGQGDPVQGTIDYFYDLVHHEKDEVNFIQSGRYWYGDEFRVENIKTFTHNFANVRTDLPANFSHHFVARGIGAGPSLNLALNGSTFHSKSFGSVPGDYDEIFGDETSKSGNFSMASNSVSVRYTYNPRGSEGNAWIDYYTLSVPVSLTLSGNQKIVRSKEASDFVNVKYVFDGSGYEVWNVTDFFNPRKQSFYQENSKNTAIIFSNEKPVHFALFKEGSETQASFVSKVTNQNLHSLSDFDFVIVTHPDFMEQSNRLADFHRKQYNQSVAVVNVKDIYNEFSAGKQDPTAIRDFIRMIYSRGKTSGKPLEHVLLMGDGSYDYKNRIEENTNYIPTFQSRTTLSPTNSYSSDDFYAILDETEGHYDVNLAAEDLDIGIGRIPCQSVERARIMVDKIIHYHDPTTFGDWQNRITFVGDDEDNSRHVTDSENAFNFVNTQEPVFNVNKIYLDAYEQQSFGSGEKYPDVNLAITKAFERGTLIFNYIGHGGTSGMAHERVITRNEIRDWNNFDQLALMVTATCELSRFDDPAQDSPGELMLFNPHGGAMGLVTTMRLVRITLNSDISSKLWNKNIVNIDGGVQYLGETFLTTKNNSVRAVNQRNFSLLGDPAMKLAIPEYKVVTTKINDSIIGTHNIDTFKAFSRIKISGEIRTPAGQLDSTFNGFVYPTVFDKFLDYETLLNDPDKSSLVKYKLQNSVIYRGKVSAKDGKFSFQFVVPKDISYHFGYGKISYFAENGELAANGYDGAITVGGSITNVANDSEGPDIQLFMNDESWVFGGTTTPAPLLLCKVFDENGINTVGNGIGRDITAILDAGTENEQTIVLNDFYQATLDSYQEGEIRYNMEDLNPGKHTLKVRVWDVYNNVSEDNTEFIVATDAELAINHLLNFPNPFTTSTEFHFDHNKAGQNLDVLLQIVTPTGRIVKSFNQSALSASTHFSDIQWDGKDEFGDQLARGVYLYKLTVVSEDGQTADATQKLVILK